MKNLNRIASFTLLAVILLSACAPQPTPVPEPAMEITPSLPVQPSQAFEATVFISPTPDPLVPTPQPEGFTVTDALGRAVRFEAPPQRMVLVGKAWFLLVDAIYAFPASDERLIAMSTTNQGNSSFFPVVDSKYAEKTLLDNDPGAERIAALQPDVVLMKSYLAESMGKPLEEVGIPVVYLDLETPEQYQRDLQTIGQLFQDEARTQAVKAYFEQMTAQVTSKTAGLSEADKPTVLVVYYDDRDGEAAVQVPPLSWIQTTLVEMAGGRPVWNEIELGKGWTKVNFEQIAVWNPDQIFVVSYTRPVGEVLEILKADPQWQALQATRNGELYGFAADYFSWDQPDTRWVLGLNWLATKIQPDLFADLDIEEAAREFYATLYGFNDATFDERILPQLKINHP